jgi:hypothetical protein
MRGFGYPILDFNLVGTHKTFFIEDVLFLFQVGCSSAPGTSPVFPLNHLSASHSPRFFVLNFQAVFRKIAYEGILCSTVTPDFSVIRSVFDVFPVL